MIRIEHLDKTYKDKDGTKRILNDINFEIEKGTWCRIVGPSGTGKTTLLNCISGLLEPDEGKVIIDDVDLYQLSQDDLSNFRRKNIGFIFQDFKLLPHYSVLDNVIMPLVYEENSKKLVHRAKELLDLVGIDKGLHNRFPEYLSGGEKQRVAIARAMISEPKLLLCDEPTGNLDIETRDHITNLLKRLKGNGQTIIVVTHDMDVAKEGDECFQLKNGELKQMELIS